MMGSMFDFCHFLVGGVLFRGVGVGQKGRGGGRGGGGRGGKGETHATDGWELGDMWNAGRFPIPISVYQGAEGGRRFSRSLLQPVNETKVKKRLILQLRG